MDKEVVVHIHLATLSSKVKRQLSGWEKIIVKETTDKELLSKIYKQLIHSMPEKQTTQSKNREKT